MSHSPATPPERGFRFRIRLRVEGLGDVVTLACHSSRESPPDASRSWSVKACSRLGLGLGLRVEGLGFRVDGFVFRRIAVVVGEGLLKIGNRIY